MIHTSVGQTTRTHTLLTDKATGNTSNGMPYGTRICVHYSITHVRTGDSGKHRGETCQNRQKFRRDTKKGIHKTSGQFISVYFSLFSLNSGPYLFHRNPIHSSLLGLPVIKLVESRHFRMLQEMRHSPCCQAPGQHAHCLSTILWTS